MTLTSAYLTFLLDRNEAQSGQISTIVTPQILRPLIIQPPMDCHQSRQSDLQEPPLLVEIGNMRTQTQEMLIQDLDETVSTYNLLFRNDYKKSMLTTIYTKTNT